jgi:drug/metabolite transporter (DMT)-like permease
VGNGFLFAGLSMTLSAKAGFINSLYVTMVPLVGLVLGVVPSKLVWVGLAVSVVGLGFISGLGSLESEAFNRGDAYVLVADLFWATHIFILGYFTVRVSPWLFIFSQTVFGCVFSFVLAHITADSPTMAQFIAIWPYAVWGIFSVAGAYVCQATAQRTASPTSAALVMQSQAIIAGISGVIILNEKLTLTMIMGAFLMVGGTIVAQLATDSTKLSPDLPHYRGWQTVRVITAFVILAICAFAVIQT